MTQTSTTLPALEAKIQELIQTAAQAFITLFQTPEWKRFMEAVNGK